MKNYSTVFVFSLLVILDPTATFARSYAPLSYRAYDGGVISAETLGRGGTLASNRGTHASGSENPASLSTGLSNSMYSTVLINPSSSLDDETLDSNDSLRNRTLQYVSIGAEKGVLFYEPLSRIRERQITDDSSPSTNYQDVEYSANALGFGGVDKFGNGGQVGISLAYIWSSLVVHEKSALSNDVLRSDNFNGLRMNLGFRYPIGPTMWGLSILNGPGFLWGKRFRREMLPLRIRVGNTWKIHEGVLLSIDGERRYYNEGGRNEDYVYVGLESFVSKTVAIRAGAFGTKIDQREKRHLTTGVGYTTKTKSSLSYAYEVFELDQQKVKRSVISLQLPFSTAGQ